MIAKQYRNRYHIIEIGSVQNTLSRVWDRTGFIDNLLASQKPLSRDNIEKTGSVQNTLSRDNNGFY